MTDALEIKPDFAAMPLEAVVEMAINCISARIDDPPGTGADSWLIQRPPDELLPVALALADDPRRERRILAAHLLGQTNWKWPEIRDVATSRIRALLESETDAEVLRQASIAAGFWKDEAALPALVRLKSHADCDVRYGVALGLSGIELEAAKRHLIELTRDDDEDVRDWAVFGLGQQTELDFPELRTALIVALTDPVAIVRGEALAGLAVRKDRRAIPALIQELTAMAPDDWWPILWESAETLVAPELMPILQFQFDRLDPKDPEPMLAAALAACQNGKTVPSK